MVQRVHAETIDAAHERARLQKVLREPDAPVVATHTRAHDERRGFRPVVQRALGARRVHVRAESNQESNLCAVDDITLY